jgi:hypothetical protein
VDRRRIRAYLTPRGRAVHERISRSVRTTWETLGTTDDELLAALLTRVIDALDPTVIEASPK